MAASTTATNIANRALILVGSATISDITSTASREAVLCNAVYDDCRRSQLRLYPWKFARARVLLDTPASPAPDLDYENAFDLPSGCLRVYQVGNGQEAYQLEQNQILSNADEVELYYITDITDVAEWDALFIEVMAHYLAWTICKALTDSARDKDLIWEAYKTIMPKSRHVDSGEGPNRSMVTDDWVISRGLGVVPIDRSAVGIPR